VGGGGGDAEGKGLRSEKKGLGKEKEQPLKKTLLLVGPCTKNKEPGERNFGLCWHGQKIAKGYQGGGAGIPKAFRWRRQFWLPDKMTPWSFGRLIWALGRVR